jgi:hypothetical protein
MPLKAISEGPVVDNKFNLIENDKKQIKMKIVLETPEDDD